MQIFSHEYKERINKVKEGIDFILSHFEERQQLFPRKISTSFSNNRQFTVYNKQQILTECIKANFIDCRINAYPVLGESHYQAPNIIFIDLDLSKDLPHQEALKQLEKAENLCIKIIKEKLDCCIPTVLWTGNGHHIYIVLDTRPLELVKELKELSSKPSEEFLKFAGMTFSNKKKNYAHNPTFKSSLLRIPYTFNSKNMEEVKIIQEFDKENIPSINSESLRGFRLWLADNEIRVKQQKLKNEKYNKNLIDSRQNIIENYFWIEKLLQTPIPCFRRFCLYRIVAPYLVNIKKLNDGECFNILKKWLEKCDRLSKISFNIESEIKERLKAVKSYKPISIQKLRKENFKFYNLLCLH